MSSKSTRVPGTDCPSCQQRLDAATGIGGRRRPKPGNVTLCFYCGHILVFDEGLLLREPTGEEMHEIAGNKVLLRAQALRLEALANKGEVMKSKGYEKWVDFLSRHGDEIEVVSDGEAAEQADVTICRLMTVPLLLPDNLVASCSECRRLIQFRPHAPKTPRRLCDECAGPIVAREMKDKDFRALITERTVADVAALLRRKGQH